MVVTLLSLLLVTAPVGQGTLDIEFWYGPDQVFGELGNPQAQINILGNVSASAGLMQLTYRLDGGPELPINFGPDTRRLLAPGDFNIELFLDDLAPGAHEVVVRAVDEDNDQVTRSLDFSVMPGTIWPLPYTATWIAVPDVPSGGQPVDGHWFKVNGGVRCSDVGYDRLLAIGDTTWTNYEVTVPITIHSVDPLGYQFPSVTPGIGIIMRWNGHTPFLDPDAQPLIGYWPLGAAGQYVYKLDGCGARLQLYGNQFVLGDEENACTTDLALGVTYIWKMRVQTHNNGNHAYKLKVWPQGSAEPVLWNLEMIESPEQPTHGSLLLLAHHVDATFGNVQVTLPDGDPAPPPEDVVLIRSRAELFGDDVLGGKVIYREIVREGDLFRRFNVTANDAAPGQLLAVHLQGALVGFAEGNQNGVATLELRTPAFIDDPETQDPMPGNFPTIIDLETVTVGPLAGVFFDAAYTLPGGEDLIGPQYKVSNSFFDGITGMHGEVLYRERIKNGMLDRRLAITASDGEPNSFRWFRINGEQKVAKIHFDANGFGQLELRTADFINQPAAQIPMPDWFPSLMPGEIVRIGHIHIELTE